MKKRWVMAVVVSFVGCGESRGPGGGAFSDIGDAVTIPADGGVWADSTASGDTLAKDGGVGPDTEDATDTAPLPHPDTGPADGAGADAGDGEDVETAVDAIDALSGDADTFSVTPDVGDTSPDVEAADGGSVDAAILGTFEYGSNCFFPSDDSAAGTVGLEEVFAPLSFIKPVGFQNAGDGSDRLFVVEQTGRIKVFANEVNTTQFEVFLDLSGVVTGSSGEGGLLGLAFHPDFATNGQVFVNYTTGNSSSFHNVIARFTVSPGNPNQLDSASETEILILDQPYTNHNGGHLAFGPDGYLYIGTGDGGSAGDPLGNGQDTTTLLGAMLRIDVDNPAGGEAYGIPASNPFANGAGDDRPEIFAWGLRNPWRYSFDAVTGALWVGDVGQNAVEEVDVVELGKNYGWNEMEGSQCYPPGSACDPAGLVLPVVEYTHDVGTSITGGFVYRGASIPSLYGKYVYGDYLSQVVFAFAPGQEGAETLPLLNAPGLISSFGVDEAGELYVFSYLNGKVYRFVEEAASGPTDILPETLVETGCFLDMVDLEPVAGVLGYDIVAPFWSDTATKTRYVSLPDGGTIGVNADHTLTYPPGTLFIKQFDVEQANGEYTRVETRILALDEDGVRGYAYRWNDAGTEAVLLESADTRELEVVDPATGESTPLVWQIPSREQCQQCHTAASGGVLGADEVAQMNREVDYGAVTWNQLLALDHWALLDPPLVDDPSVLPALVDPLGDIGTGEEKARSYLQANCAGCHLPGGPAGPAAIDLRYATPLGETGTCGVPPNSSGLGLASPLIVAPGDPEGSILYLRLTNGPPWRMPPLASSLLDGQGAEVIADWITSLGACP